MEPFPYLAADYADGQPVTPLLAQFGQLLPRSGGGRHPGLGYHCVQLLGRFELRDGQLPQVLVQVARSELAFGHHAGNCVVQCHTGECLLTMPYGEQEDGNVAIGSLDLLAETVQPSLMDTAAAVSAGGRAPERVRDLVSRVGHTQFDLVIMNPPFVRSTGMEAEKRGTGNPAFAAFDTDKATQRRMQDSLAVLRGTASICTGNAGLAADFLDLALRKVRQDGVIALVLPLSAASGTEWEDARKALAKHCQDIIVVTVAGVGSHDSSFSADTGMAECLLVARRGETSAQKRATFVMLRQRPKSTVEAELLATEISRIREFGQLRAVERLEGRSVVAIGESDYGVMLDAPLPDSGPWPLVGIRDEELAQVAWNLEWGALVPLGQPNLASVDIAIAPIGQIGGRGPYHADIYWDQPDGTPRGPFELIKPAVSPSPTYPMLWAHAAKRERRLVVDPDSEGRIKAASGKVTQDDLMEKAASVWGTATRAHYNRDLRFNSQSLIVAMTDRFFRFSAGLVAGAGAMDSHQPTGSSLGVGPLRHQSLHSLALRLWAYHAFPTSSFIASRSIACWATIFFSLLFSASSSLSRRRDSWSMSRYLLRQRCTVASDTLYCRHTAATALPDSTSPRIRRICSSVYRVLFMKVSSSVSMLPDTLTPFGSIFWGEV